MIETAPATPADTFRPGGPTAPARLPFWLCLLGGVLIGLPHGDGRYAPAAWLGLAVTAAAMHAGGSRRWLLAGLLLGGSMAHWVGHTWHWFGLGRYLPPGWTLPAVVPFTMLWTWPQRLPLLLAAWWCAGRRGPTWLWFAPAYLLGEWWHDWFSGLSHDALLYSQWQLQPVLRAVGHLGWAATALAYVASAAAAGEALVRRSARLAGSAAAVVAAICLLPPLPGGDPGQFAGIGAVHMANYALPPRRVPPGVELLIWPELVSDARARVAEGPGRGQRLAPPMPPAWGVAHLYGMRTRVRSGLQNALLALAPDGTVLAARAKRRLFPLSERPLFGYLLPGLSAHAAGRASPVLTVNGRRYLGLICVEELDRALTAEGLRQGADMIAIVSNDWGMLDAATGHDQVLAVAVLRAVESGLPVVRSGVHGRAAFVAPDGRVLALSELGTTGVLTLAAAEPLPGHAKRPGSRAAGPR